ncbi:Hypothetical protein CINCED_3A009035 [Cinara cedri]|uniref:Uncharacterized protein n=1 Tax=Cinara cedri TaxID=506608 RepID=A0A5E4MQ01_9HEMI|nr:Hypothetical protein CINCED_3A009035 [Cinara cedri]
MPIVFFDINGIVMTEWVPRGQTFWQRCANEFVRNGRYCGKTSRGSCTRIKREALFGRLRHSSTRTRQNEWAEPWLRLLLVSEDKVCLKRNPVWVDGRGETKIGGTPERSYENRLSALPQAMEETNETVCEEGRGVY